MNGWFPKIADDGRILSGADGIWLTEADGITSRQLASAGTSPFWLTGGVICYNRNDGTTQIGGAVVPAAAYNEYYACGDRWTGFTAAGDGLVDFYRGTGRYGSAHGLCRAIPVGTDGMVYLAPFQPGPSEIRALVYNNTPIAQGRILTYVLSPSGLIAWQEAVKPDPYARAILNQSQPLSIRTDEAPLLGFDFLGQTYLVTQAGEIGQFVYPLGSHFGFVRRGVLEYPDGKVFGTRLRLVGSTSHGEPLFNEWIDLLGPRVDLRNV